MKKLIASCTVMLVAVVFAVGSVPLAVQAANVSPRQVLSSSDTHTMVIDANGTLWGWGSNEYGQVGDGTTINRDRPVAVMQNVVYVEAVNGRTFAVNADGVLFAWGNNQGGLLGDGTNINRHSPIQIHQGILLTVITPQPPVVQPPVVQPPVLQPTPPPRQGVGFFANFDHFQQSGLWAGLTTVQSLGNHHANSFTSTAGGNVTVWRDYNLNSQHTRLSGFVVRVDGGGTALSSVTFFGDGRELLSITTNEHDQPHPVTIDLTGINILRIEVNCRRSAFTNAIIY